MKIKVDFITNSSSTAYIVFIPDNFDISDFKEVIEKSGYKGDYEEALDEYDGDEAQFMEQIANNMETLRTDGHLWAEDIYMTFWSTLGYLEEKKLVIHSMDTGGGGGMDVIDAVKKEKVQEMLKRMEEYEGKT